MAGDDENALRRNLERDSSPWSEYRRLVLAELERINVATEQIRAESRKLQTDIAIIQERIEDSKRSRRALQDRVEALVTDIQTMSRRISSLEKGEASLWDKFGGVIMALTALAGTVMLFATVWSTWFK